jgi:hypothetical protein
LGVSGCFLLSLHSNSYDRYKVQLVDLGNRQKHDIDYNETFILVVKMTTMHIIITLVVYQSWPLHQMDVNNTFLHGDLKEKAYIKEHGLKNLKPLSLSFY